MSKNEKMEAIVKILAKQWFYGDWKAETRNERVQQMLMEELGLYPFKNEDTMIRKTQVDELLYEIANKPKIKNFLNKFNELGLLNYEGEVFVLCKHSDNEFKPTGYFSIKDHFGKVLYTNIDREFVMRIYRGEFEMITSDNRNFNLSEEPEEFKPTLETLLNFLDNE